MGRELWKPTRRAIIQGAGAVGLSTKARAWTHGNSILTLPQLQANYVAQSFGIFLHFNMATFTNVEHAVGNESPSTFNPSALSIDQWMTNIVAAKAKYAVLVAKHQDGFCLWPTATTPHSIASSSWYAANGNPDIVAIFVSKCRQYGIKPAIYFSNRDTCFEINNPGFTNISYKNYLIAQLTELLSNYGPLTAIWTDATWWSFGGPAPWNSVAEYLNTVHGFQNGQCLLVNNSHNGNFPDTDIVEYENGTGGNGPPPSNNATPAECCETSRSDLNWFWKTTFSAPKSTATLLANLATFNSEDCTYLLNFPPDTTGNIPSESITAMAAIGAR